MVDLIVLCFCIEFVRWAIFFSWSTILKTCFALLCFSSLDNKSRRKWLHNFFSHSMHKSKTIHACFLLAFCAQRRVRDPHLNAKKCDRREMQTELVRQTEPRLLKRTNVTVDKRPRAAFCHFQLKMYSLSYKIDAMYNCGFPIVNGSLARDTQNSAKHWTCLHLLSSKLPSRGLFQEGWAWTPVALGFGIKSMVY